MSVEQLQEFSVDQIKALHGMGPSGVNLLLGALEELGLPFKPSDP